jgi:hypothetical protein
MTIFQEYVAPRIKDAEWHLDIIRNRKIPYAIARDDFARVQHLADMAIELQEKIARLRGLEGLPEGFVIANLASL